ncbi:CHAT domain-containing protein [Streptomyces sp. NPDC052095]|uniref:CHAT domain-containing protein n=1 Tax=unclassified Streptomyces TaxID=2593676 RepID=UPI00344E985F
MNDTEGTGESCDADLRERVADAVRRSEGARALPAVHAEPTGPQGAERDGLISELLLLASELTQAEPGGALLQVAKFRLGTLIGSRWATGEEEPDRQEAMRLLREVRASGLLSPEDHLTAARDLIVLLQGPAAHIAPGRFDDAIGLDGLSLISRVGRPESHGGAGSVEAAPEAYQLMKEVVGQKEPTPEVQLQLRRMEWMSEFSQALTSGDQRKSLAMFQELGSEGLDFLIPSAPMRSYLQTVIDKGMPQAQRVKGAGESGKAQKAGAGAAEPEPDWDDGISEIMALLAEMDRPGLFTPEEFDELTARLMNPPPGAKPGSEIFAALGTMLAGLRSGRLEYAQSTLRLLREAARKDEVLAWVARVALPGLLIISMMTGGSLQDLEAAEGLLEEFLPADERPAAGTVPDLPGASEMVTIIQCMRILTKVVRAIEDRDTEALEGFVGDLLDILDAEDTGRGTVGFLPLYELGMVHLGLAHLTGSVDSLRSAVHYQEQALKTPGMEPMFQPVIDMSWAPLLTLSSYLEPSVERLQEGIRSARSALRGIPAVADQRVRAHQAIGMALDAVYGMTGDPAVLDELISELDCPEEELAAASGTSAALVRWALAEAYGRRAAPGGDDLVRAVRCARESLRVVAEDVLLQQGVQHGLQVARTGARRALRAAGWAVRSGRPAEAVACLEEGRALVLGAAAVSATVAERLEERGEHELADRWRREASGGAAGPRAEDGRPGSADAVLGGLFGTLELPSTLRRRALELLRSADGAGAHGAVPEASELVAAVGRAGVDALVYLLPGQDGADGAAVLLAPGREPWTLSLPGLSAEGRAPLDDYLDAAARHATARRGQQRWEAALDELCAWAGEAVMGPVLDELGLWERGLAESAPMGGDLAEPPARAVRLTLIACGNLGVVPWQAALLTVAPAATPGPVPDERPATVRACEVAVLSYAASGREFVRSAGRERLPAALGRALVCVPGWDLEGAESEVLALADTYYPDAALYGTLMVREGTPEPPEGTPGTVLALLGAAPGRDGADRVALVHLACHGMAGPDPAASALELDPSEDTEPESGRLTVTALLDAPPAHAEDTGGPLVVLSACETDLSTRDHDEALTLTTALAHRLAADVVGSRWTVPDLVSSVLMTVFHDRVDAGLAPPDALRAAQRWMLAPPGDRPPVRGLTPGLVRAAEELDLSVPFAWAAFIHQGNPGPAVRTGGPGGKEPVPARGETRT